MKIVATTSLPAVDRPNADRWNAARSRQYLGGPLRPLIGAIESDRPLEIGLRLRLSRIYVVVELRFSQ